MSDEVTGSSQEEQAGKRLAVVVGVNGQPTSSRVLLHYAACRELFKPFLPAALRVYLF
ncbi:hypothetical protein KSF_085100 [Reticulibacter mediterranei]|uniref:Uncharacterized protein n=1 Tax=Reticulibacter mediterranei TaxID=2778369 RepID=A0A8J3N8P5_9CHLR|nr:hypothetical protein [Reticulibacter mediterranei]GHO98462.1 hypothetical protein KSF_085100 [Reticulibacter mediterranei]